MKKLIGILLAVMLVTLCWASFGHAQDHTTLESRSSWDRYLKFAKENQDKYNAGSDQYPPDYQTWSGAFKETSEAPTDWDAYRDGHVVNGTDGEIDPAGYSQYQHDMTRARQRPNSGGTYYSEDGRTKRGEAQGNYHNQPVPVDPEFLGPDDKVEEAERFMAERNLLDHPNRAHNHTPDPPMNTTLDGESIQETTCWERYVDFCKVNGYEPSRADFNDWYTCDE